MRGDLLEIPFLQRIRHRGDAYLISMLHGRDAWLNKMHVMSGFLHTLRMVGMTKKGGGNSVALLRHSVIFKNHIMVCYLDASLLSYM